MSCGKCEYMAGGYYECFDGKVYTFCEEDECSGGCEYVGACGCDCH